MTQTTNPVLPGADFGNQSQPYSVTVGAGEENLTADFGYNWGDRRRATRATARRHRRPGLDRRGRRRRAGCRRSRHRGRDCDDLLRPGRRRRIYRHAVHGAVDQNGNTGTGTTTTEPDGNYIFANLPAGSYVVVVDAACGLHADRRPG